MVPHLRCKSCRKWQEHCYQEHMTRERVSFFKLMTGDFVKGIVSIHYPATFFKVSSFSYESLWLC
jgi:hypothetical protein